MRRVICAFGLLVAPALFARNNLTLVFQFEGRPSESSVSEMKKELQSLFQDVQIDWKSYSEVTVGQTFDDLVLVKFRGACIMASFPPFLYDERGPLAITHTDGSRVLP